MMRTLLLLLTVLHRLTGALKSGNPDTVRTTAATVYDQIEAEKARLKAQGQRPEDG